MLLLVYHTCSSTEVIINHVDHLGPALTCTEQTTTLTMTGAGSGPWRVLSECPTSCSTQTHIETAVKGCCTYILSDSDPTHAKLWIMCVQWRFSQRSPTSVILILYCSRHSLTSDLQLRLASWKPDSSLEYISLSLCFTSAKITYSLIHITDPV